ncbi:MAG: hypothetical protein JW958_00505 [Candidatus Eisenbacteria bacterium]|nr:hypothetical protein [Candidatus Eisenbacteria bacterium]
MEKKLGVKSRASKEAKAETGKTKAKAAKPARNAKIVRPKSRGDKAAAAGTILIPERPTPKR